jgi:cytochrome c553
MTIKNIIKLTLAATAFATLISLNANAEDASVIWTKTCAACHGKDGKGQTKMGRKVDVKDYTDPKVQADLTDEKAVKSIKEGIKDDKGKERMKAYADAYSDEEIKNLIAYIRAFKPK